MGIILKTFPNGRFRKCYVALCAVRDFGDYSFEPSTINLNTGTVKENYEDLKPRLMRVKNRRYYIGGNVLKGETKERKNEPSRSYSFLPVYASMAFGAPCIGRLIQTENGDFVGSIGRMKVIYNDSERYEWEKKDGEVISFTLARVEI